MKTLMKKPPMPREHGAWVMLLVPLLLGNMLALSWNPRGLWVVFAALCVFLARQPITMLCKTRNFRNREKMRAWWRDWLIIYFSGAFVAGSWLLLKHQLWWLSVFALPLVLFLVLDILWVLRRESMTVKAEVVGVLGLSLGAPISNYVVSGQLSLQSFVVGVLCALYFIGSIFYIKLKVRKQPKAACPERLSERLVFGKENVLYHLGVFFFLVLCFPMELSGWVLAAFLPVTLKAIWGAISWQEKRTLNLMKFGILECFHAIAFGVLLLVAFT